MNRTRGAGLVIAGLALSSFAFGQQEQASEVSKFKPRYLEHVPNGFLRFAADQPDGAASSGLPTWTGSFTSGGKTYNYTMLGADPATGVSTTLPVVFIPVIFKIGNVTLDPTKPVNQGTRSAVTLLEQSPVFTPVNIQAGPVNFPNSQYEDAFRRANFFTQTGADSNGYHVLLGQPTVKPAITLTVPATSGETIQIANPPYNSTIGNVSINYFQTQVNKTLAARKTGVNASEFVIFVYYNVFFYQGSKSNCCILGFHSQDKNLTYSVAAYNDPGEFTGAVLQDIEVITHEIGEAYDDPTVGNTVPAWGNIGQVSGCQSNLEVGDPVTGTTTSLVGKNGVTYTPEDLVFHDWFTRISPSTSVNGWYTLLNTFHGAAKACPPGGTN